MGLVVDSPVSWETNSPLVVQLLSHDVEEYIASAGGRPADIHDAPEQQDIDCLGLGQIYMPSSLSGADLLRSWLHQPRGYGPEAEQLTRFMGEVDAPGSTGTWPFDPGGQAIRASAAVDDPLREVVSRILEGD